MKLSDFKHGTIVRIDGTTNRLYRLEILQGGILGTMTRFPRLQPCAKRNPSTKLPDDHWWDDHNAKFVIRNWSDECELVDDTKTAVAGEVLDTRL
jgi:hypothetical protein